MNSRVWVMLSRILEMALLLALILGQAQAAGTVLTVDMKGTINPASDDIVLAALERAEAEDARALLLLLDTPGGGLAETTEILRLIDESEIPVIGYVHPEGAVAWSAGTIILMGSDIAAMAPHTIIGSAQPVQFSPTGSTVPVNDSKTINAIVAMIEEKARKHGRNTTAAREFVLSNLNLNADEAKNYRVIEHISPTPEELLGQINGTNIKDVTLISQDAKLEVFEPPLNLQFLKMLSDPTIAGLLMLIGLYSLIFGFSSPGMGAEVFGLIALAMGLIGLGFNVNIGAIFLILLGLGLILAELHSHTFGILAVAGLVCVIAGSILFVPTSFPEWYVPGSYQRSMALALILPSLILGLFMAFAIYKVAQARFAPMVIDVFEGKEAVAIDRLDPKGYVLFQGEYWLAEAEGTVEKGEKVIILTRGGGQLKVRAGPK
ncbi:MAG: nodulation protein NfeD [Methanothrix sp.]|uniref:NfeD family protein n=1 Tax=Methanothrix sp. TaxID=90426 RepID=UPI003BB6561B